MLDLRGHGNVGGCGFALGWGVGFSFCLCLLRFRRLYAGGV